MAPAVTGLPPQATSGARPREFESEMEAVVDIIRALGHLLTRILTRAVAVVRAVVVAGVVVVIRGVVTPRSQTEPGR